MKSTRSPIPSHVISAAIACVLCFVLAGCSDQSEPAAGGGASATAASDGPGGDATETAQKPTSGRACLTGAWLADNAYFLTSIREFGDEIKDVSGEVTVTFADDGALTTVYDNWLISAVARGMKTTIQRTGTDRGSFTATDTTVSLKEVTMGSALKVTAAGTPMTVPAAPINYADAAYTCSTTAASITTPDGTMKLTRR